MKGKFIVLEGLEGAGKTTAIEFIKKALEQQDIKYLVTREPGGCEVGEKIRQLLKDKNNKLLPKSELLLIIINRLELVEKIIKPALSKGVWVVGDRHYLSTLAYQGGGRKLDESYIEQLHSMILGNFSPDLYIYLDIDPVEGFKRVNQRGELDRFEQEKIDFFYAIRKKYLELIKEHKAVTIDASLSLDEIEKEIKEVISEQFFKFDK